MISPADGCAICVDDLDVVRDGVLDVDEDIQGVAAGNQDEDVGIRDADVGNLAAGTGSESE